MACFIHGRGWNANNGYIAVTSCKNIEHLPVIVAMHHQFRPFACQNVAQAGGVTEGLSGWCQARQRWMMNHDSAVIALGLQIVQKPGQELKLFGTEGARGLGQGLGNTRIQANYRQVAAQAHKGK